MSPVYLAAVLLVSALVPPCWGQGYGPLPTKGKKHRTTTTISPLPPDVGYSSPPPDNSIGSYNPPPQGDGSYWWQNPNSPFSGVGAPAPAPSQTQQPPLVGGGCGGGAPGGCGGGDNAPIDIQNNPFLSGVRPSGSPPPITPSGQTVACSGAGYICAAKHLCSNGVVNQDGEGLFQVRSQVQYCDAATEVCCRLPSSPPTNQGCSGGYGSGGNCVPAPTQPGLVHVPPSQPGLVHVPPSQPAPSPSQPGLVHVPPSQPGLVHVPPSPRPSYPTPVPQYPSASIASPTFNRPLPGTNGVPIGGSIYDATGRPVTPAPSHPYTGPLNTTPHPGCAAALKCVPETYCTAEGVMANQPVTLTREQYENRVPMSDCADPDTGVIGKCCRDPNYKDPWPGGMMNMAPDCSGVGGSCVHMYECTDELKVRPITGCSVPSDGASGVCCANQSGFLLGQPGTTPIPQKPIKKPTTGYPQPKPFPQPVPSQPYPQPVPSYQPQPKPSPQPYPQPVPSYQPQPKPSPQPYPQPVPSYQPQPKPSPQPFPQPVPSYQPQPKPSPQPYPQPVPSYQPQPKPSPQPYPQPIPSYQPQPKPSVQPFPQPTYPQPKPSYSQSYPVPQPSQPIPSTTQPPPSFPVPVRPIPQPQPQPQFPQPQPQPQFPQPVPQPTQPAIYPKPNPGVECGIRRQVSKEGLSNVDAGFGEFPWHALVLSASNKSALCSAAIISDKAVVTAAHCVQGLESSDIFVQAGVWKLHSTNQPKPVQVVPVAALAKHPSFDAGSLFNDLAVLVLGNPLRFDDHIDKICLPPRGQDATQYQHACIATGWGKGALQGNIQGSILHQIPVRMIPHATCEDSLRKTHLGRYFILNPSFQCAVPTVPSQDLCKVDVGGPIACDRGDGHHELSGLYSWDVGCTAANSPTVFGGIDVAWIESVLARPVDDLVKEELNDVLKHQQQQELGGVDIENKPGFQQGYGKK